MITQTRTPKEIGEELRVTRKAENFSQEALADQSGVLQVTLSQWERDGVPEAIVSFGRVCGTLKKDPGDFIYPRGAVEFRADQPLPTDVSDDLRLLMRTLIRMHHKAGPGVSPVTIFKEHVDAINDRFLGRLPAPLAERGAVEQLSAAPLDQRIAAIEDTLLGIVRELPGESSEAVAAVRALDVLTRRNEPQARPTRAGSGPPRRESAAESESPAKRSQPQPVDRKKKRP